MPDAASLAASIHASPSRGVVAVTGGGSGAIAELLQTPGASATVLEATVPYANAALDEWVGGRFDSACSEPTARAIAMQAMKRARRLAGVGGGEIESPDTGPLFGVGCTASLASNRPKRGDHRLHVALQTVNQTVAWSLTLDKGRRSRAEEEAEASRLVMHAVACACGLVEAAAYEPSDGDQITHREKSASVLWQELFWGEEGYAALITPAESHDDYASEPGYEKVLFPGSFAPPHQGHRRMVEHAQQLLGRRVALELSISNVDKPPLDFLGLDDRLTQIAGTMGDAPVWLTRLPTFRRKAKALSADTFVVGADTVTRIADARYYADSSARDAAIAEFAAAGCRFLVFGRQTGDRFETLADLDLPPTLAVICDGVPANDFREDISSTALRRQDQA